MPNDQTNAPNPYETPPPPNAPTKLTLGKRLFLVSLTVLSLLAAGIAFLGTCTFTSITIADTQSVHSLNNVRLALIVLPGVAAGLVVAVLVWKGCRRLTAWFTKAS